MRASHDKHLLAQITSLLKHIFWPQCYFYYINKPHYTNNLVAKILMLVPGIWLARFPLYLWVELGHHEIVPLKQLSAYYEAANMLPRLLYLYISNTTCVIHTIQEVRNIIIYHAHCLSCVLCIMYHVSLWMCITDWWWMIGILVRAQTDFFHY